MDPPQQSLYLLLVLAADGNGVSSYRKEKICDCLRRDDGAFQVARDRLVSSSAVSGQTPTGSRPVFPTSGGFRSVSYRVELLSADRLSQAGGPVEKRCGFRFAPN